MSCNESVPGNLSKLCGQVYVAELNFFLRRCGMSVARASGSHGHILLYHVFHFCPVKCWNVPASNVLVIALVMTNVTKSRIQTTKFGFKCPKSWHVWHWHSLLLMLVISLMIINLLENKKMHVIRKSRWILMDKSEKWSFYSASYTKWLQSVILLAQL